MIRAFPRRTKATPDDAGVRIGFPLLWDNPDEVHISVSFSWDIPLAQMMVKKWEKVSGKVKIGGPAMGTKGNEFKPGEYIKKGYTITSRGCPNKCWFCDVWKRDGKITELEIKEGWNVLDDNLLACSDEHIEKVFQMLMKQGKQPEFTGGLEAKRLKYWHLEWLQRINPKQMFFAYDTSDDYEPLLDAGIELQKAGFTQNQMRCYVLIGYPKDTFEKAEQRLKNTWDAGFLPMAMLYRKNKIAGVDWKRFQRKWARSALIKALVK